MDWVKEHVSNYLHYVKITFLTDIDQTLNELTPVFVIAAIIGVYLVMAGAKKKGSQISSISILSYVLLKAVLLYACK